MFEIKITDEGVCEKLVVCGNISEITAFTIAAVKVIYDRARKTNKAVGEAFKEMFTQSIVLGFPFMEDELLDSFLETEKKKIKKKNLFSGKGE